MASKKLRDREARVGDYFVVSKGNHRGRIIHVDRVIHRTERGPRVAYTDVWGDKPKRIYESQVLGDKWTKIAAKDVKDIQSNRAHWDVENARVVYYQMPLKALASDDENDEDDDLDVENVVDVGTEAFVKRTYVAAMDIRKAVGQLHGRVGRLETNDEKHNGALMLLANRFDDAINQLNARIDALRLELVAPQAKPTNGAANSEDVAPPSTEKTDGPS